MTSWNIGIGISSMDDNNMKNHRDGGDIRYKYLCDGGVNIPQVPSQYHEPFDQGDQISIILNLNQCNISFRMNNKESSSFKIVSDSNTKYRLHVTLFYPSSVQILNFTIE